MLTRVHGVVALALLLVSCRDLPGLVSVSGDAGRGSSLDDPNAPPTVIILPDPNAVGVNSTPTPVNYLSTHGGQLTRNGSALALHGVGWFGFETSDAVLQGNWTAADALTSDVATVARRMRLLGINAVRIPFSFKMMAQMPRPASLVHTCSEATDNDLAASVTAPGGQMPSNVPPLPKPPTHTAGQCNDYLPTDSPFHELVWVTQFFARNGFYVLLDDHGRTDDLAITDPNAWLSNWKGLVTQLVTDPNTAEQLIIGPLADAETLGLSWQAQGGKVGAGDLFLRAMDALQPLAPHALFYIGGTAQQGIYANGFATTGFGAEGGGPEPGGGPGTGAAPNNNNSADNAAPFFRALVQRNYARQVVMAPNAYGPGVISISGATTGPQFMAQLTRSFGYLNRKGFCDAGVCTRFAVSVWGFGSDFSNADASTMNDIASYLTATGGGNDGQHDAIQSWFYWCWNGTSTPSFGLLDTGWFNLQWSKVAYLRALGL